MATMYSVDQEKQILSNLLAAMREGKIESLTFKRNRKGGKQFVCEVNSKFVPVIISATSTEGVHDLGVLFVDTVARAGMKP